MQFLESTDNPKRNKNKSDDRIIVLKPIEGKNTIATSGLTDNRLFTGENKLHAIVDHNLWLLKYDSGVLPTPLRQRFTSFNKLMSFITEYFKKRNIEVKEVID